MSFLRAMARAVSGVGLTAVGGVHLVWATGSSWPARDRRRLAQAVVGGGTMPPAAPTATVAGAALFAGALTSGALGEGRVAVGLRRLIGCGLLARAVLGGEVALKGLGMPRASTRFTELDNRWYRPLCAVLGAAVLIGSRRRETADCVA